MPNTSSPSRNLVTSAPIATAVPATSSPGTRFFGPRNPKPKIRIRYGLAPHQMTCAPVHASRTHLHQDLIGCDSGLVDL